ncbi:hypothetical protein EV294_102838 [Paenibacillus sp. BK033]|uniref:hypothetical protein n=1 Tax=Paenibacillus sp. BK033 TaxID=2512133 RepID=UPI0010484B6C|nr:hypothetical protein [Paenibacillus sp. BK033]TCM99536.1 hypothetical protein EV294_102838 [Paenibacillus sp. BK033]
MFNCIGKVIVVNNSGIIHFGFAKQIAPESIQVGNGNGSTTSEEDLEETGRETENQANGNGGNGGDSDTNGNSGNKGNKRKVTNGKSKGASKSKSKPTGKTPAAANKKAATAAAAFPNLPFGKQPFGNIGKNHPLLHLMKKRFK